MKVLKPKGADYLRLATVPFVFLFYLFYDIAYTPMLIAYTLEILPFNIRAKGFAVMVGWPVAFKLSLTDHHYGQNLVVSLTLAFNQFVNPWALDAIGWKYVCVQLSMLGVYSSDLMILVPGVLWMAGH